MQQEIKKGVKLFGLLVLVSIAAWAAFACQNTGSQSAPLFSGSSSGKERWTIRCTRIEAPNHQQLANGLAEPLKKVRGLNPAKVHVVSEAGKSTIFYGEYEKVRAADGTFVFPPDYQRDVELIRSLSFQNQTPFFFAQPELISTTETAAASGAPGDVSTAKGAYSLEIAVFYNTADFDQRKEAAEAYVKSLRERGYSAYYYHEQLRSFVYVGDFDASDLIQDKQRQLVYGPRVEQFIARNPEEFKFLTENGMKKTYYNTRGSQVVTSPSMLMPIPGKAPPADRPAAERPRLPGESR